MDFRDLSLWMSIGDWRMPRMGILVIMVIMVRGVFVTAIMVHGMFVTVIMVREVFFIAASGKVCGCFQLQILLLRCSILVLRRILTIKMKSGHRFPIVTTLSVP